MGTKYDSYNVNVVLDIILLNIIKIYGSVKEKNRDELHCEYKINNKIFCLHLYKLFIKIIL